MAGFVAEVTGVDGDVARLLLPLFGKHDVTLAVPHVNLMLSA